MTLIEVLVTVTIMGIVFAVFVGGIGVAIHSSELQKRAVTADTVLRNATEALQRADYLPYMGMMAGPPVYDVSSVAVPAGYSPPVVVFKGYLSDPPEGQGPLADQFLSPCAVVSPCPADGGVQLLEITVASSGPGGHAVKAQSVELVKRA